MKNRQNFLHLENKNFISKHIRELKQGNKKINNPDEILEEMRSSYASLFKNRKNSLIDDTKLRHIENKLHKLNDNEKEDIEKEIT